MRYHSSAEKGKTFVEIIRTIIILSVTILLLFVVGKWFFRVLFEDSVVDSTLKEVASRAITASTRFMHGDENLVGSEFGERTEKGYPVLTYKIDENFFEITLIGVSDAVCRRISERGWTLPTSLYINGNLSTGVNHFCVDFNLMSFEFSRDLNSNVPDSDKPRKKHCQTDADCSACEACRNNLCKTGCNSGESCSVNLKGNNLCCQSSQAVDSLCCAYVESGNCCWGRGMCCPMDNPIRLDDGTCTNCYDPKPFAIGDDDGLETCQKLCPNRVAFGADNLCMLPICKKDQFTSREGACIDCQTEGAFETSAQECSKCPNRTYQDGLCSLPCPQGTIRDVTGQCLSCDVTEGILLENKQMCSQFCPNRQIKNTACVLADCPAGMIADRNGECISCEETKQILLSEPTECAKCPNRELLGNSCVLPCPEETFRTITGECVACGEKEAYPVFPTSGECLKCPERLGLGDYCFANCRSGEFRDSNGACRSCLSLQSYEVSQTAVCSICPYRTILLKYGAKGDQAYCKLQQCPMDYFADQNGSCHDCYSNQMIAGTTKEECDKCPNRVWSPENDMCLVRPNCPVGSFMDTYGGCHECSDENALISVQGHLEECNKCPLRYAYGYWCLQCPKEITSLTTKESCQKCGGKWDNRIQQCM